MKRNLLYAAIGLITCLGFITVMAPASLLVAIVGDDLREVEHLAVGNVSGRIWQGEAEFQYRTFPPAVMAWELNVLPLLTGSISGPVTLAGDGLDARFDAVLNAQHGRFSSLDASVQSSYINDVTVRYGLDLSGGFRLEGAGLQVTDGWIDVLDADLSWTGGIIHIETPEQIRTVKLPPLRGNLYMAGEDAQLMLYDGDTGLMEITLAKTGWVRVEIAWALLFLTGISVPGSPTSAEEPAVILEEKVF